MHVATLATNALITKVKAVIPLTYSGRSAQEATSTALPILTVWPLDDAPFNSSDPCYTSRHRHTRNLVLELKVLADEDWPAQFDDHLFNLRKALYPQSGNPILDGYAVTVSIGEARFIAPADNGDTALLQLRVSFDYIDKVF